MLLVCTVLALVLLAFALYALGGVFCMTADLLGLAILSAYQKVRRFLRA